MVIIESEHMPVVKVDDLNRVCFEILQKVGLKDDDIQIIVESLIEADLRGITTHGVFRLPNYIEKLENGLIEPNPQIKILKENSSIAVLDAGSGFGQVIGIKAMDLAIKKAEECGIGMVSVSNSNHFGMAAFYAMHALSQNMIGIVMANSNPAMAPFGGMDKQLGTNPLCYAIPAKDEEPIVLDMAMSKVARGKIRLAAKRKKNIPKDWATDKMGYPTEDPESALEGALLPFGGPKGSGLAIIIDILTGVLSGGAFGKEVGSMYELDRKCNTSFTMLAININNFIPIEDFLLRVDHRIKQIRTSSPSPGVEKLFLPGMIEAEEKQKRILDGIPLSDETWNKLLSLSA
jgi:LDH2 family malate/lactate/ureidoglycolate dehydrogenase